MCRLPALLVLSCALGCTPTKREAQPVSATVVESAVPLQVVKATEPQPALPDATVSTQPKSEDPDWLAAIDKLRRQSLDRSVRTWGPAWERAGAQVDQVVAAVAADDPRYAEAHCTWAEFSRRQMSSADPVKHLLQALESIRARTPVDAADRFRSLDHSFLITDFTWKIGPRGMLEGGPQMAGAATRPNACRNADEALLRNRLISSYQSPSIGSPRKADRKRSAREMRALFEDVSKALGPKHAYVASLYEIAWYFHCRGSGRRLLGPACPGRRGLQNALQIRQAELGEDHLLTRASMLHLAASHWLQGSRSKMRPLLEKLMSGTLSDEYRTIATVLVALLDEAAGKREQALKGMDRAASAAVTTLVDNSYTHHQLHILHGELRSLAGRHRDAVASYRAARSLMPPLPWVKKRNAELLRAAGMNEQALVAYNGLIATQDTTKAANAMTKEVMNLELLGLLRVRRELLKELGQASQEIEKTNRRILDLERVTKHSQQSDAPGL